MHGPVSVTVAGPRAIPKRRVTESAAQLCLLPLWVQALLAALQLCGFWCAGALAVCPWRRCYELLPSLTG